MTERTQFNDLLGYPKPVYVVLHQRSRKISIKIIVGYKFGYLIILPSPYDQVISVLRSKVYLFRFYQDSKNVTVKDCTSIPKTRLRVAYSIPGMSEGITSSIFFIGSVGTNIGVRNDKTHLL